VPVALNLGYRCVPARRQIVLFSLIARYNSQLSSTAFTGCSIVSSTRTIASRDRNTRRSSRRSRMPAKSLDGPFYPASLLSHETPRRSRATSPRTSRGPSGSTVPFMGTNRERSQRPDQPRGCPAPEAKSWPGACHMPALSSPSSIWNIIACPWGTGRRSAGGRRGMAGVLRTRAGVF
jgi:hypothetical protein